MEEEVANFIPCLILSCLQHTDAHFYFKAELSKLIESDMFESISDCVMHFYIAFDAEYKAIIEKVFENPQFMKSKSRFLIKIGSRCLKMCDDPTFFNFLLMCAFVGRVVSFCYTNGKCYRVVENACKCAVATFKRKFLELFNREGDLNGLRMYSDGLNETVLDRQDQYDDLKDILCPDLEGKQLVLRLLESCQDVDSDQYFLTDFERKLLYKVTKKRLRKLKPNLDFLICRIPRKYFQMQNNQDSQNVMHNVFGSNLVDIESNLRAEYRMRGDNPLLSPPSISCRTDSWSLPINYTTKRNSEPSNYCIIEKRSEPSNYCIIEKRFEPSNYCIIEKRSEASNCFNIGNKSESLECCITEKRFEPSNCCVIEKQPELSNCCITENEIEPLNYCIAKKDSELSIKETIPEGSLSLVNHKTSREEFQSANFETSSKQPKSATQSPRMLKRSSSGRSMNPELSKRGDRISPNYLQIGTSPKTDTASFSKRPKISNSPQSKLSLETSFTSSQQQFLPPSLDSPQTALYLPFSFSTFEDKSPNTKRCSFEMEVELSKKYSSKFRITSDEDHSIQNYPSTSSFNGNFLPFELQKEAVSPFKTIDSLQKPPTNSPQSPQEQYLATAHQDKPSLKTHSEMASASCSSDHDSRDDLISVCSLSSASSSSSSIQLSSEGYYTSESDFSDESENEEFQSYFSPLHSYEMTCSVSSPSESEYYYADWEGDVTLKSLMRHKCFHCRTKCFNYIMYVFQQFTSHFLI